MLASFFTSDPIYSLSQTPYVQKQIHFISIFETKKNIKNQEIKFDWFQLPYNYSQKYRKYPVLRRTAHLNIPYYVRDQFHREFQGTLARLENTVEEEYVMIMKQNCYRERGYRKCRSNTSLNEFLLFHFFYNYNIWLPHIVQNGSYQSNRTFILFLFSSSGEMMIGRARNFGSPRQLEEARALKITSCENLARIGLTKFMPN